MAGGGPTIERCVYFIGRDSDPMWNTTALFNGTSANGRRVGLTRPGDLYFSLPATTMEL